VPAFVLIAPPPNSGVRGSRSIREQYLERMGADGRPTFTRHAILAKRFASAAIARRWASQWPVLEDFVVARR
jgi:hypothetical protein